MTRGARRHGPQPGYWARMLALSLWGPAQLDPANDPREQLRRDYGRPHRVPSPRRHEHAPEWVRLTSDAVAWSSDTGRAAEEFDHRLSLGDGTT